MQWIQICCVQETRWNPANEWLNGQYYVCHHGSGRSGGLMTMVSATLAPRSCRRTCTMADGRIQHTRIFRQKGSIAVINIYQRVWSHESTENIIAQRLMAWNALRALLDSLPARNQVLVCGDMNTQLPFTRGVTSIFLLQAAQQCCREIAEAKGNNAPEVWNLSDPYTRLVSALPWPLAAAAQVRDIITAATAVEPTHGLTTYFLVLIAPLLFLIT